MISPFFHRGKTIERLKQWFPPYVRNGGKLPEKEKDREEKEGVWRKLPDLGTILATLYKYAFSGKASGSSEHQATSLGAPLEPFQF